jgi:hypothetical protein
MDLKEFGRRLQMVREQILRMNQTEIAWNLRMSQTMYSRLESGLAGNIHTVFRVVNFLRHRELEAHMMFVPEFDLRKLEKPAPAKQTADLSYERVQGILDGLKDSAKEDYEKLVILKDMLVHRPSETTH